MLQVQAAAPADAIATTSSALAIVSATPIRQPTTLTSLAPPIAHVQLGRSVPPAFINVTMDIRFASNTPAAQALTPSEVAVAIHHAASAQKHGSHHARTWSSLTGTSVSPTSLAWAIWSKRFTFPSLTQQERH